MLSARTGSTSANHPDRDLGVSAATSPDALGGLFGVLGRRARSIVTIAAAVFVAVMIGWALWPAKYTAVSLVALDPQTPRLTADRDAQIATGDASAVVSLAEVATSDAFLVALAQQQKLVDDPEFSDGSGGAPAVVTELRRSLKVTRRGLSYLIDISFTSSDADKAARIANAAAAELVQRQQALRKDASGGISEALRSRLADLRAAVLASEKAVADYRLENDLLEASPDNSLGLKRLNSLTEQLGPLRARLEDARARFEKLRKVRSDEDADPSIFRSDRLTELLTRLGEEKRSLAAAERTYGPRHPSVEGAQAKITSIQEAVKAERSRIVEQAKAEVDVLTEQNAAYEKEIAKRTREQLATEQKQVVLQDLVRQAQADRQIYEQFLARQKSTQEQSDLIQPEAVVVSAAEPPTKSSRPGLKLAALAALLGGLGTGVLWVMFGPRSAPLAGPGSVPDRAPPPETMPVPPPPAPVMPEASAPEMPSPVVTPPVVSDAAAPVPEVEPRPVEIDAPALVRPSTLVAKEPEAARALVSAPVFASSHPVPAPQVDDAVVPTTPEPVPVPDRIDEVVPTQSEPPIVTPAPVVAGPAAVAPADVLAAVSPDPNEASSEPEVRVSARRNDPAQRLRRMLRTLNEHDVPLVADLTRADVDPDEALAPFAATLDSHLARTPGLVLSVVGVDGGEAPTRLAAALADAVADRGHVVAFDEDGDEDEEAIDVDAAFFVAIAAPDTVPEIGEHAFVLLVAEATREAEERLEPTVSVWESDPDRVVVAAFVPSSERVD